MDDDGSDSFEPTPLLPPQVRGWMARRRRPLLIGAAALAVVFVAVLVAISRDDTGVRRSARLSGPVAAARVADHRPHGPTVRTVPFNCGMSTAVLRRLVGAAEAVQPSESDAHSCTWGATEGRSVSVKVQPQEDEHGRPDPGQAIDDVDDAIDPAVTNASDDDKTGRVTALAGLGDHAVAWTVVESDYATPLRDPHRHGVFHGAPTTTVAFQAGNVSAVIAYGLPRAEHGVDLSAHPVDTTTLKGALAAATTLARTIGAPVRGAPHTIKPSTGPYVPTLPSACDIVPPATLKKVAGGQLERDPENGVGFHDSYARALGISGDECSVSGDAASHIDVSTMLVPSRTAAGDGTVIAARDYDSQYRHERDTPEVLSSTSAPTVFAPVKGVGDEAFAAYDGVSGTVSFRLRNAVVSVTCARFSDDAPSPSMNCAYTAAAAVARRLAA